MIASESMPPLSLSESDMTTVSAYMHNGMSMIWEYPNEVTYARDNPGEHVKTIIHRISTINKVLGATAPKRLVNPSTILLDHARPVLPMILAPAFSVLTATTARPDQQTELLNLWGREARLHNTALGLSSRRCLELFFAQVRNEEELLENPAARYVFDNYQLDRLPHTGAMPRFGERLAREIGARVPLIRKRPSAPLIIQTQQPAESDVIAS